MKIYEISNPSDAYTIASSKFITAAVATLILGDGKYGLKGETPEDSMPIFLFGGAMDWLKEQGITDLHSWLTEHATELADVLEAVIIGSRGERAELLERIAPLPHEEKKSALEQWHAERRGSL